MPKFTKNKLDNNKNKGLDFSVIIPVFFGTDSCAFKRSINSVLDQTIPPNEILIIVDGPINEVLTTTIDFYRKKKSVKAIFLETNQGPGVARSEGIAEAKFELIALMDSDDIAINNRFEKQLPFFIDDNYDVVGGWIEEFSRQPNDLKRIRKVPSPHEDIIKYSKWRSPVNNVTIMFTKNAYFRAGGYNEFRYYEDYALIINMILSGSRVYNIPEVLVEVCIGDAMISRRKLAFKNTVSLFVMMYKTNYINFFQLFLNLLPRLIILFVPNMIVDFLYSKILRGTGRNFN